MSDTATKRFKPQTFNPTQTWFRLDRYNGCIEPVRGVHYATRTTVKARNGDQYTDTADGCIYQRSEVFPTYEDAANALVVELQRLEDVKRAELEDMRLKFQEAGRKANVAAAFAEMNKGILHPDAMRTPRYWLFLLTPTAYQAAQTLPDQTGKLNADRYWTDNNGEMDRMVRHLQESGLQVA